MTLKAISTLSLCELRQCRNLFQSLFHALVLRFYVGDIRTGFNARRRFLHSRVNALIRQSETVGECFYSYAISCGHMLRFGI